MQYRDSPGLYFGLSGLFVVVVILSCWRTMRYEKRRRANNREAGVDHLPVYHGAVQMSGNFYTSLIAATS
ncbi:heparan-alpha-glucosaminide N-acetyltransferase-like [Globisporangium polare]